MKINIKKSAISLLLIGISSFSIAADKALIIGVGEYQDSRYNLSGIDLDVAMIDEVAQRLGFRNNNITHLSNSNANRKNILSELNNIANSTSRKDRVLIYYSGHGAQVKDTNGDEPDQMDETLFVYDGHLIDDDINIALSKIKSNNMVVLIDACHSGTGTKSIPPNSFSKTIQRVQVKSAGFQSRYTDKNFAIMPLDTPQSSSQNYVSIGAAQDDEQSLATPEGSLFTKSLYESLEEARKGSITPTWRSLYESTSNKINKLPLKASEKFSPKIEGNSDLLNKRIRFAEASSTPNVNKQKIIEAVNQLPKKVDINAPSSLNVGEEFVFTVNSPMTGYLNVVTVGADDSVTVLFPNKYSQDNKIGTQSLEMPGKGKFKIVATEPRGETLVAAFVTKKPIDLTGKGFGFLTANGMVSNEAFASISGIAVEKTMDRRNLAIVSNEVQNDNQSIAIANYAAVEIN